MPTLEKKKNVVHMYNGLLYRNKVEIIILFKIKIDGSQNHDK
jgi:hypothetical protein